MPMGKRSTTSSSPRFALSAMLVALVTGIGLLTVSITPASAAVKATKAPLVFGVVATQTGPAGFPQQGAAMLAYAKYWNSQGGFQGHPIEILIKDGGLDTSATALAARQLVTQDNVLAMIQNYAVLDCQVNTAYYASVPIGVVDSGATSGCYNPKVDFVTDNPAGTIGFAAAVKWGISKGAKHIALLVPDLPQIDSLVNSLQSYVTKSHQQLLIERVPLVPTAADLDGPLVAMKAAGVDMVLNFSEVPQLTLQEANRQSFGPSKKVLWVFANTSGTADASTLPGAYIALIVQPWNSANPQVVTARKIVGKIKPLDTNVAVGYQAIVILRQVLGTLKGPVSRASILQALRHDTRVPLPLTSLITNPTTPTKNPGGGVIQQSVNGAWKTVTGFIKTSD